MVPEECVPADFQTFSPAVISVQIQISPLVEFMFVLTLQLMKTYGLM